MQEKIPGDDERYQLASRVFRVPIILGLLTTIGLISALVGDDHWDVLSWLTLLAPLAAVAIAWRRRDRSDSGDRPA